MYINREEALIAVLLQRLGNKVDITDMEVKEVLQNNPELRAEYDEVQGVLRVTKS